MLQVVEIQDIAEQGYSEPYRCKAENGLEYFVKGLRSRRSSQINEWLCANMAQAIGLPIAPFCLLEVAEDFLELLPPKKRNIGQGAVFASQAVLSQTLLEIADIDFVAPEIQRQIVAFDWFIQNMDRTPGDSNLLIDPKNKHITVIDHNLAFDPDFQATKFCQQHIFQAVAQELAHDWVYQQEAERFLLPAIAAYHRAYTQLPPEWEWKNLEQDLPTNYPFEQIEHQISRLQMGALWSHQP